MSSAQQALAGPSLPARTPRRPRAGARLHRGDAAAAVAFVLPYAAVFLAFVVYPVGYALWMARDPALYAELAADPIYLTTLVNTLLFVGIGVNLKMFVALLLSGFFRQRRWWIKALLPVFLLPWALSAVQAFISFHWILIGEWGFANNVARDLFGIEAPIWFGNRWLALGCNIAAYIWKWLPFWTVIFLAGRLTIPQELYDAAELDGASGLHRFVHVTWPLLANLYFVCTLLSTVWTVGDFNTAYFVTGGAPVRTTEVLATLGFRYAFDAFHPHLGVATALSALPLLIPVVILLIRRFQTREVQL